jgi:hypothetical protein
MRLLTSGCSFTKHCWTTWPDILGKSFNEVLNVGYSGQDNASIARSIVNNVNKDDVVVILWSGYDRWSFYSDENVFNHSGIELHWQHGGAVFAAHGKEFFTKYYHKVERFQTTMDYIQLIDLHSKNNGYTAYHFSAFPFYQGEIEKDIDQRLVNIYKKYNIRNDYLTEISLDEFTDTHEDRPMVYHKYAPSGDAHPLPLANYHYVEQIIAPRVGIDLNSVQLSSIIKEHNDIVLHGKLKDET